MDAWRRSRIRPEERVHHPSITPPRLVGQKQTRVLFLLVFQTHIHCYSTWGASPDALRTCAMTTTEKIAPAIPTDHANSVSMLPPAASSSSRIDAIPFEENPSEAVSRGTFVWQHEGNAAACRKSRNTPFASSLHDSDLP